MSCALITIWILLSGRTQRLSRNALASISPKPFPCSKCGKSYGSKSTLNRHLREECGMRPQNVCCYCRKAIHQRSNFKRHIEKVHGCVVSSYITSRNLDDDWFTDCFDRFTAQLRDQSYFDHLEKWISPFKLLIFRYEISISYFGI